MAGVLITATPRQLLTGLPLGPQGTVRCQCCGTPLYEGETVNVVAARPVESTTWALRRVRCRSCRSTQIRHPTLGWTELLVHCRLGTLADSATQQTRLVVLAPTVLTTSQPAESWPPAIGRTDGDPDTTFSLTSGLIEHGPTRTSADSAGPSVEPAADSEVPDER